MVEKRRDNAYDLMTRLWSTLSFPIPNTLANHSYMFFPAYATRRDELMVYLEKNGIQTRTMMPLISQPITKPYLKGKYPVAKYIEEHGILLPVHQYLKQKDLDYMVQLLSFPYIRKAPWAGRLFSRVCSWSPRPLPRLF
jgi:dTDP-4-amino-4,6-dideoxygalactose transaminase